MPGAAVGHEMGFPVQGQMAERGLWLERAKQLLADPHAKLGDN
jgi:hypothetical protein